MPAHRAYQFLYRRVTWRLDDDARLEVDAILGDVGAEAQVQANRRAMFEQMERAG